MLKRLILLCIVLLQVSFLLGQDQEDNKYTREFIWGINKNTNSGLFGGLILKHGRAINERMFHYFGLELINVKHPKELRYRSNQTGNFFIWAKQHYLYSIRPQYGREFILFRKNPQQGVQINAIVAAGPTIGLLAPYYLEYQDSLGIITIEAYNPNKHKYIQDVYGTDGLPGVFRGIGNAQVKLGINLKTSISFEFGAFKRNVTGFEVGFMLEAFTEEIIIVPTANNRAIFPSAFISFFYGTRK